MARTLLNVAALVHGSRVNGPGVRSVVFVQGCTLGCPGCWNPQTHAHEARRLLDPRELARRLAAREGEEGVTLLGGEPFQQAEACAELAEAVRAAGRSVMVFSGYTLAALRRAGPGPVARLLAATDILAAGPYVAKRRIAGRSWVGSSNQRVHFLTDRYDERVARPPEDGPAVEVRLDANALLVTGYPEPRDVEALARAVRGG